MKAALAKRYARLLTAYSSETRATRKGEDLDALVTLAAVGQSWPTWREAKAIIFGGLADRTLRRGVTTMRGALREGIRGGFPLLVALQAGFMASRFVGGVGWVWVGALLAISLLWMVKPHRALLVLWGATNLCGIGGVAMTAQSRGGVVSPWVVALLVTLGGSFSIIATTMMGPLVVRPFHRAALVVPMICAAGAATDIGRLLLALAMLVGPTLAFVFGKVSPHLLAISMSVVVPVLVVMSSGLWLMEGQGTTLWASIFSLGALGVVAGGAVRLRFD